MSPVSRSFGRAGRVRVGRAAALPNEILIIDARLAKADEDIKAGRVYGPFDTMEEFERSLRETGRRLRGRT